jgi:hypothetical protein
MDEVPGPRKIRAGRSDKLPRGFSAGPPPSGRRETQTHKLRPRRRDDAIEQLTRDREEARHCCQCALNQEGPPSPLRDGAAVKRRQPDGAC